MPIKISKTLINKLPLQERHDIKEFLLIKAGGKCFLCGEPINEASDNLVADHDKPEAEHGDTVRKNLNLVHHLCNSFKKNAPSIDVRPYLRLSAFFKRNGPLLTYGQVLPHFDIVPKPSKMTAQGKELEVHFPNGDIVHCPVFDEKNRKHEYQYAYIEMPREALFNDQKCQPRNLKLPHVWAIYGDINRNPLHEAPGCRIEKDAESGLSQILMFDGQHKTIATWMANRKTITAKVYLNLTAQQAIELVNSVQSKIKKLPLSPFELAAKLADEWRNKLEDYTAKFGEDATEAGFIEWLPQPERSRAKDAFKAALVEDILDDNNLAFRNFVERAGESKAPAVSETTFKNKVLESLLQLKPLSEIKGNLLRDQEHANIVRLLNSFVQAAFVPEPGTADLSPQEKQRSERMLFQSSLAYISKILVKVFELFVGEEQAILRKMPTEEQWAKIEQAIDRIVDHPVWTADFDGSAKLRRVDNALQRNQDAKQAFEAVGLSAGYAAGLSEISAADLAD